MTNEYFRDVARLSHLFFTINASIKRGDTERQVNVCFPGDLKIVYDIVQKVRENALHPATAHLQVLRANALAEKIIDGLRDGSCQLAADVTSKVAQKKMLAALRRMPMGEEAETVQKTYEDAHAAVAAMVCKKGTALKVARAVPGEKTKKQRAASPATVLKKDVSIESEDSEDDVGDYDYDDGWLVDDDDYDEEEVLQAKHNDYVPYENDPEFLQTQAQHAQTALARQQRAIEEAKAKLAAAVDVDEREGLEERIRTITEKDIRKQQKIIADALRVKGMQAPPAKPRPATPPAAAAAAAGARPVNILIPRRKIVAAAPVPVRPASPIIQVQEPARRPSESGKKTKAQWKAWAKKVKAGSKKKPRRNSVSEKNDILVCNGNACVRKPKVIVISSD